MEKNRPMSAWKKRIYSLLGQKTLPGRLIYRDRMHIIKINKSPLPYVRLYAVDYSSDVMAEIV